MNNAINPLAISSITLVEPVTGKILFAEPGVSYGVTAPHTVFVSVDTQKYQDFMAQAQTTAAASLVVLAQRREELLAQVKDPELVKHLVDYCDYGIGHGFLTTPTDDPQTRNSLFEQLCEINKDVFTAMRPVVVKNLMKKAVFDDNGRPSDVTVSIVFADHTGKELVLDAINVHDPRSSNQPWRRTQESDWVNRPGYVSEPGYGPSGFAMVTQCNPMGTVPSYPGAPYQSGRSRDNRY